MLLVSTCDMGRLAGWLADWPAAWWGMACSCQVLSLGSLTVTGSGLEASIVTLPDRHELTSVCVCCCLQDPIRSMDQVKRLKTLDDPQSSLPFVHEILSSLRCAQHTPRHSAAQHGTRCARLRDMLWGDGPAGAAAVCACMRCCHSLGVAATACIFSCVQGTRRRGVRMA